MFFHLSTAARQCRSINSRADGIDAGSRDCPRRLTGIDDRAEVADDCPGRGRQRLEPYGGLGNDAEGALRANHEGDQVIAGDTLGGCPAEAYEFAGAGHHLKGEHVILGDAVLDTAHATGIGRDAAANGRPGGAGRSGGYHSPCSAAAVRSSSLITPAWTTASRSRGSIRRIWLRRSSAMITPPLMALAPLDSLCQHRAR